ncbi:unnamed protein product, partial [Allacma fusca]
MATEKALRASLSSIKGKFTSVENGLIAQGTTRPTQSRFETIKKCLDNYWMQNETIHESLQDYLADAAAENAQVLEHATLFKRYCDLVERAETLKPNSIPTATKVTVKLHELKPPTFDGDITNWTSFHDLFTAAVHNNVGLEPAQKLQYLVDSMKGEAGGVINHLSISDNNYAEAWKLLKETYDRKNVIIDAHLHRLFVQPLMKEESAKYLRKLVDTTKECCQALRVFGQETDKWDSILIYVIREKLDMETKRQWLLTLDPSKLLCLKDLLDFIDKRSRTLQDISTKARPLSSQPSSQKPSSNHNKKETKSAHVTSDSKCRICNQSGHFVYNCPSFQKLSPSERMEKVKNQRLCFNCLFPGHMSQSCPSKTSCKKCSRRHHSMVHFESAPTSSSQTPEEGSLCAHVANGPTYPSFSHVLLPTAVVNLLDSTGRQQSVRALLDSGSESSFITESCVKKLGLKTESANVNVNGLASAAVAVARKKVQLSLSSRIYKFNTSFEALVVAKVTGNLPTTSCRKHDFEYLKNLPLADPFFYDSKAIDLLLGADIFYQLNRPHETLRGPPGFPSATDTMLGWVIAGQYNSHKATTTTIFHLAASWRAELPDFGDSRLMATRRWFPMEKRMANDSMLRQMYIEFMREYASLGHMKKVHPHHIPVGPLVGPKTQDDLIAHLIRFRIWTFVMKTDAKQIGHTRCLELQSQLLDLFHVGKIELRKWTANHPDLLSRIPDECCE